MSATAAPAQAKRPAPLTAEAEARAQALSPSDRFAKIGGYAPVPHLIQDISTKVSGHVQHILLDAVIHATFGAPGNPEYARVRLSELATKSPYTRQAFRFAAEDAVERGLLKRQRQGKSWAFKTVPENWASIPDYVNARNPMGTDTPRDISGRYCLHGGPVRMSELWDGMPGEMGTAEFVERLETKADVEVRLEVERAGQISIIVLDRQPVITESPKLRSDLSTDAAPESPKLRSDLSNASTERQRLASVLDPIFLKQFGKVPDKPFLNEIIMVCGGAPVDLLLKRIADKVARGAIKSSGLILHLAADAHAAWHAMEFDRAPGEALKRAAVTASPHCPRCQGYGYDFGFYDGCESGADLNERGIAPPCPACKGTGNLDAITSA
jgi:hypothetical protein